MGLRDELEPTKTGVPCGVQLLLNSLSKETAKELSELIDDPLVTASSLERLARKHDWGIRQNVITRHRRGECKCR